MDQNLECWNHFCYGDISISIDLDLLYEEEWLKAATRCNEWSPNQYYSPVPTFHNDLKMLELNNLSFWTFPSLIIFFLLVNRLLDRSKDLKACLVLGLGRVREGVVLAHLQFNEVWEKPRSEFVLNYFNFSF